MMASALAERSVEKTKLQKAEELRIALINERASHLAQYKEIGDNISPARQRYLTADTNKGSRRNRKIIDSTATKAMRTLRAGMMSGVTSPARDWFKIGMQDIQLMDDPQVRLWCDAVNRIMRLKFNQTNLYQELPNVYGDLGTFGTAAMQAEEDMENVVRFYTFPVGSYMIANDERGKVCVFLREFRLTVRQVIKKFQRTPGDWSNISDRVKIAYENNRLEEWIDVCHVIMPNEDYDKSQLRSKFKKFSSCYWERGSNSPGVGATSGDGTNDGKFLRESGYDIFPVMVPRWQLTSSEDVYGTDCPGMMMVGDVMQLQVGEKRILQAIEKMINPPMKGSLGLKEHGGASQVAGGMTWLPAGTQDTFEPAQTIDPRISEMEAKQAQVRERIKDAAFETLFLMLENDSRTQPPTAEEIIERRSEKMLALGPVMEQINQDLLDPLIEIAFYFLNLQGWIPAPPESANGQPLKVDYISIMAQAQKILGVANKERFVGFIIKMAMETQNPDVLDSVDFDELVSEYADALGIEQKNLRTKEMIAQLRAGRQQAQQAQQQAAMAEQAASAAKNLSQADMSKDSALKRLVGSQEAANSPTV